MQQLPDSRRFAVNISPRGGDKRTGAASAKRSITLRIAEGGSNEIPAALRQLLYVVLEGVDGLHLHLSRHLGEGVRQAPLDFELGVQAVAELFRLFHLKHKCYTQCFGILKLLKFHSLKHFLKKKKLICLHPKSH